MSWEPIETAPKDRRYVLVHERGEVMLGEFWPDTGHWVDASCGSRIAPTHWMPLPGYPYWREVTRLDDTVRRFIGEQGEERSEPFPEV